MAGMLVIPKFHCQRCFESWMRDCTVPTDCAFPEDPVRGAPIALDERAHVFLKDQHNVSYIEITGSQSTLNKKFRNVSLTSSLLRNKLLSSRDSRNEFVLKKPGTEGGFSSRSKINHPTRPNSEARAKPPENDEKASSSPRDRDVGNEDEAGGITDVLIKSGQFFLWLCP